MSSSSSIASSNASSSSPGGADEGGVGIPNASAVSALAALDCSRVTFENSTTGNRLVGVIHQLRSSSSSSSSGKRRASILCHGLKGNKDFHYFPQLAHSLITQRLTDVTFAFDFHGFGESQGQHKEGQYEELVSDIDAAIKFLEQHHRFEVCALIGRSMGGNAVWLYASQFAHNIPFIVGTCARFTFQDGRQFLVNRNAKHTTAERYQFPIHTSTRNDKICYLIVHVKEDRRIPVSDSSLYYELLTKRFHVPSEQCSLTVVEGADHNFTQEKMSAQLVKSIVEWMKSKMSKAQSGARL